MVCATQLHRYELHADVGIEYYAQLQKHRLTGRPESNSNRRYIDTSEFWKEQFDKVYQEKKNLERKLYILEERQRQQDASPLIHQEQETPIANTRKRPAEDRDFGCYPERRHTDAVVTTEKDMLLTLSSYSMLCLASA